MVTAYSNSSIPKLGTDGQTVFEDGITVYDKGTVNIIATAKNGGYTKLFTISVADNEMNVQDVALNKKDINIKKTKQKMIRILVISIVFALTAIGIAYGCKYL